MLTPHNWHLEKETAFSHRLVGKWLSLFLEEYQYAFDIILKILDIFLQIFDIFPKNIDILPKNVYNIL